MPHPMTPPAPMSTPVTAQHLTWGDEWVGSSGGGSAGQGVGAGVRTLGFFEVLGRGVGWGTPGGPGSGRGPAGGLHGQGREVRAGGAQGQAVHLQRQQVRGVPGCGGDLGGLAEGVRALGGSPGRWRVAGRVVVLAVVPVQGSQAGRR